MCVYQFVLLLYFLIIYLSFSDKELVIPKIKVKGVD